MSPTIRLLLGVPDLLGNWLAVTRSVLEEQLHLFKDGVGSALRGFTLKTTASTRERELLLDKVASRLPSERDGCHVYERFVMNDLRI
ncbi:MAG TPA: hypothetical protein VK716_10445 [Terracidiphilus sp.]|jgi:hypothetical protein|nr:hypothetical protein [Terracidiphilus sp.]